MEGEDEVQRKREADAEDEDGVSAGREGRMGGESD